MNASTDTPAWRCKFPGCEQPIAFDSRDRCYYHGKLEAVVGMQTGTEARARQQTVKPYGRQRSAQPGGRELQPGRPEAYPYAEWFASEGVTLVRGQDFETKVDTMREAIRTAMKRHHFAGKVSQRGDTITITPGAKPKSEEGAA